MFPDPNGLLNINRQLPSRVPTRPQRWGGNRPPPPVLVAKECLNGDPCGAKDRSWRSLLNGDPVADAFRGCWLLDWSKPRRERCCVPSGRRTSCGVGRAASIPWQSIHRSSLHRRAPIQAAHLEIQRRCPFNSIPLCVATDWGCRLFLTREHHRCRSLLGSRGWSACTALPRGGGRARPWR